MTHDKIKAAILDAMGDGSPHNLHQIGILPVMRHVPIREIMPAIRDLLAAGDLELAEGAPMEAGGAMRVRR